MRLSQGQLNLLERCPRQFQHTYLEQLGSPASLEQQERLTWGSRFHLLMQQRELGLPIASLIQADIQLRSLMNAFASVAPEILTPTHNQFRESEHSRTLQIQDYLLTVIYDLLIAEDDSAQILDWKTYPKPQNRRFLAQNWQTRLYLYVLAETSDYLPEQISMSYWFIQSEGQPQSLKFTYNHAQHQKTAQQLVQLLTKLTNWLQRYEQGESFPQVAADSKLCDACQYALRCNRDRNNQAATLNQDWLQNLTNIQEVSL